MIPHAPQALQMLSQRMLTQLVPDAKSNYSMSDGMLLGMLLGGLVSELDQGIERRLEDIRAMKAVFRSAQKSLDADALPKGVEEILALEPGSMTMEDVNSVHDAHTRWLIGLHELVDGADGEAGKVNRAIWRYLGQHAVRHALDI